MSHSCSSSLSSPELIAGHFEDVGPQCQSAHLPHGLSATTSAHAKDISAGNAIPAPLQREARTVVHHSANTCALGVGCNAGDMSFEVKEIRASYVLSIHADRGAVAGTVLGEADCS